MEILPQPVTVIDDVPKDWALDHLLQAIAGVDERGKALLPITITVQGLVVSGFLSSAGAWLDAISTSLERDNPELGKSLVDQFGAVFEDVANDRAAEAEPKKRNFVHLTEAVIYDGQNRFQVGAHRAAVSDVSGWSLGIPSVPAT